MSVTIQVVLSDEAIAQIAAALQNGSAGGTVPAALQGFATPVADFPTQPAVSTPPVSTGGASASPAYPAATAPGSDPWGTPAVAPGQPSVPTAPSAGWNQPAPGGFSAPAAAPPSNGAQFQKSDQWNNLYTFGRPDAPMCGHNQPSALKSGHTAKTNKPYTAWVCAQACDNYKAKCDFYQKLS